MRFQVPSSLEIPSLETVVLFGSRARGDFDNASDVDLAAFGNSTSTSGMIETKDRLLSAFKQKVNLSIYSKQALETMAAYGSLFFWHLRIEGKVLWSRSDWFEKVLHSAKPYGLEKALSDLATFIQISSEIRTALTESDRTLIFEASVMYTILRTTGIIVSAYDQTPCFSRMGPIGYLGTKLREQFIFTTKEIDLLYSAKMFYSGRSNRRPDLTLSACESIVSKICPFLSSIERWLYEKSHNSTTKLMSKK